MFVEGARLDYPGAHDIVVDGYATLVQISHFGSESLLRVLRSIDDQIHD